MKGRRKSKKRLVLNSRDIHVGWIVGSAIFMLVCLLATFAIAYRHDAYSAKLGLGDLMTTDVWFRVFLALTCFSLLLFLGLLVYAFIAGIIGKSGDNKGQASRMTAETPVAREIAPAFKKKASVTEQPERVIINEAKLRDVFDSPFMHEWVSDYIRQCAVGHKPKLRMTRSQAQAYISISEARGDLIHIKNALNAMSQEDRIRCFADSYYMRKWISSANKLIHRWQEIERTLTE